MAKKGFGDKLLAHLGEVKQANTTELAKVAGVTMEQAYARLMALSYEGRVTNSGKGRDRSWALPGGAVVFAPPPPKPPKGSLPVAKGTGWKPDTTRFAPVTSVAKGDTLLVEYPEPWRSSMVCKVTRPSGYFGEENSAQVWNMRDNCFAAIDAVTWADRGWKIVKLTKKSDLESLLEVKLEIEA